MSATHGHIFAIVIALLLAINAPLTRASDPPDLALNPATGFVESVDIATDSGDRVRHVEDRLTALGGSIQLVSTTAGINPRVVCRADGQTWVVWWRDSDPDEVYSRYRDPATNEWSDEVVLGETGEAGRRPEVALEGAVIWVGYETDQGAHTGVAVISVTDSPEPFGIRDIVATTDFSGDVNVMTHADSGRVWVTWVSSALDIGWSEFDHTSETWSLPQYHPYFNGNIKVALEAIRAAIVGE